MVTECVGGQGHWGHGATVMSRPQTRTRGSRAWEASQTLVHLQARLRYLQVNIAVWPRQCSDCGWIEIAQASLVSIAWMSLVTDELRLSLIRMTYQASIHRFRVTPCSLERLVRFGRPES